MAEDGDVYLRFPLGQFGFMSGRSIMEAIYLLRRVMKQYWMDRRDLHIVFIDLERTYSRGPRDFLWKVLEMKGIRIEYSNYLRYV